MTFPDTSIVHVDRPPVQPLPGGPGSRDLRLDFLRGLCLLKMMVAHGLRTPLHVPLNRVGFISAAEGFFFISGTVLGLVYRKRLSEIGLTQSSRLLLRRAALLWLSNFALVLIYSFWDWSGRRYGFFHLGYTYDWIFWNDWHWYSLLSFDQPYFLQILPRYAMFLAVSPVALWLLGGGRWRAVLAASWGIYLLEHVPNVDLLIPFFEHGREVGFRLSAWQALFFTGLVAGYERDRAAQAWKRLTRPVMLVLLVGILVGGIMIQHAMLAGWLRLPQVLENKLFARDVIGVGRVPNLLAAFVVIFWLTSRYWPQLNRLLGWLLLPIGKCALLAFLLHIPLSHLALTLSKLGWLGDGTTGAWPHMLATLLTIAVVWTVAVLSQRRRLRQINPPAAAQTALPQTGADQSSRYPVVSHPGQ